MTPPRGAPRIVLLACLPLLAACSDPGAGPPPANAPSPRAPGVCALLTVNDTYRIEESPDGTGGMARLRTLRTRLEAKYPDLVMLHAGDFLFPSLLSREYLGAHMIDVMNRLDGSAAFDPRLLVTFGNHEFDDDRPAILSARINEAAFRWVSSNIEFAKSPDGSPLVATQKIAEDVLLPCGGYKVGFFGLTTDEKKAPYVVEYRDPIAVARARTKSLRERGAEIVVGLTHLDIDSDTRLLATLENDGPDLIAGGHEHARQTRAAATWQAARAESDEHSVYKADADGHSANLLEITKGPDGVRTEYHLLDVGPKDPPPDPALDAVVHGWLEKHERAYCEKKLKSLPGCLGEQLTSAGDELVAEELEVRRFETNLGDYILDLALSAFKDSGAQIAFLNAGTIRLNYNVATGTPITRRTVEELFAYPAPLRMIEISGATLQKIVERATRGWTGQGHWLQIAGFAFRFDPAGGKVTGLTLLGPTPRLVQPDDRIKAVTSSFLLDPTKGQDGFAMIGPKDIVDTLGPDLSLGPDLKQLVVDALKAAGPRGIAPGIDGRICNAQRKGPCLAK